MTLGSNTWIAQQSAIAAANAALHGNAPAGPQVHTPISQIPSVSSSHSAPATLRPIGVGLGKAYVDPASGYITHAPVAPPNLSGSNGLFRPSFLGLNRSGPNGQAATASRAGIAPPHVTIAGPHGSVTGAHSGIAGHAVIHGAVPGRGSSRGNALAATVAATKHAGPAVNHPTDTIVHAGPPPPDAISQMIAASLQQARGATDYYNTQTDANQKATTDNASALATAAGSLSSTVPNLAYADPGAGPLATGIANHYTDLINAVGSASAKADAQTNQAVIADSANAMQKMFGGDRAAVDAQAAQFGQRLTASEPQLRADKAAADAKAQMDAASAQYLRDKLSLSGKQALDNSAQGWAKINQTGKLATQSNNTKLAIAQGQQLTAQQKAQQAAALAGQKASKAQKQVTINWINKNLLAKDPTTGATTNSNASIRYTDILDQLGQQSDPISAAQVAITYRGPQIQKDGANNFYTALTVHGIGKRQALKLLGSAGFSQKQINEIKRYGVTGDGAHPGVTGALGGAFDAVKSAVAKA